MLTIDTPIVVQSAVKVTDVGIVYFGWHDRTFAVANDNHGRRLHTVVSL